MDDFELIGRIKAKVKSGIIKDKQSSWSEFVRLKNLNPGMDAKDYFKIYDEAMPIFPSEEQPEFHATHIDPMTGIEYEVKENDGKVVKGLMKYPNGTVITFGSPIQFFTAVEK